MAYLKRGNAIVHGALDYEEGTFIPELRSSEGGSEGQYASTNGVYTKVGRMVVVNLMINLSGLSGVSAGDLWIQGLPYPPDNVLDGTSYEASGSCSYWTSYGPDISTLIPLVAQQGHILLNEIPGGGSDDNSWATIGDLESTSSFRISATYFIGGGGS